MVGASPNLGRTNKHKWESCAAGLYSFIANFPQSYTHFQWEFIFVRHYVHMWFTSCMIVGLDRISG